MGHVYRQPVHPGRVAGRIAVAAIAAQSAITAATPDMVLAANRHRVSPSPAIWLRPHDAAPARAVTVVTSDQATPSPSLDAIRARGRRARVPPRHVNAHPQRAPSIPVGLITGGAPPVQDPTHVVAANRQRDGAGLTAYRHGPHVTVSSVPVTHAAGTATAPTPAVVAAYRPRVPDSVPAPIPKRPRASVGTYAAPAPAPVPVHATQRRDDPPASVPASIRPRSIISAAHYPVATAPTPAVVASTRVRTPASMPAVVPTRVTITPAMVPAPAPAPDATAAIVAHRRPDPAVRLRRPYVPVRAIGVVTSDQATPAPNTDAITAHRAPRTPASVPATVPRRAPLSVAAHEAVTPPGPAEPAIIANRRRPDTAIRWLAAQPHHVSTVPVRIGLKSISDPTDVMVVYRRPRPPVVLHRPPPRRVREPAPIAALLQPPAVAPTLAVVAAYRVRTPDSTPATIPSRPRASVGTYAAPAPAPVPVHAAQRRADPPASVPAAVPERARVAPGHYPVAVAPTPAVVASHRSRRPASAPASIPPRHGVAPSRVAAPPVPADPAVVASYRVPTPLSRPAVIPPRIIIDPALVPVLVSGPIHRRTGSRVVYHLNERSVAIERTDEATRVLYPTQSVTRDVGPVNDTPADPVTAFDIGFDGGFE